MMRKIFGVKSISHLIYGLLMLAPILAIGVKCGYVMLNKNAYQSYSNQYVEKTSKLNSNTTLVDGIDYTFKYNQSTDTNIQKVFYNDISINWQDYGYSGNDELDGFGIRYYAGNQSIFLYSGDNAPSQILQNVWGSTLKEFTINKKNNLSTNDNTNYNIYQIFITTDKLDNVFYYAIDEIIQDNNFGKINFTGWFDNMMLDNNIQINQTYTHLFNWYLNYTLFISCAYILWLVLMWFVNFARKLLDRGMNYDW